MAEAHEPVEFIDNCFAHQKEVYSGTVFRCVIVSL